MTTIRSKIIDTATGAVFGFFISENNSGIAEAEYCDARGLHVVERKPVFCYDRNRSGFIPLAEIRDAFSMAEVSHGVLVKEVGKLPDQAEWEAIDAACSDGATVARGADGRPCNAARDDVRRWAAAYAERHPAYKDQVRAAWEIGYNRTCRIG